DGVRVLAPAPSPGRIAPALIAHGWTRHDAATSCAGHDECHQTGRWTHPDHPQGLCAAHARIVEETR
ncbi:hypothetical protein, partial [Enterococcus hirae]|uniref:hypothetical protein n=1 Tax=Enterococcus hirae TaxID=1354 RepID=UPI001964CAFC